ncbi:phage tail protein [Aeromonas sp. A04]|uniref:phage tail-collar fiber domain-containing protein n=1 Tax=Aeromonas sp. A04 TaxID=3398359 RepID=UPI0039F65402
MSQVITNAFEQYWQSSLAAEQPVVLDEFILADIPNLDITSPIDPATGLPLESQIVHRQNVDQRGRINNNAVAYTIVMDTTIGDFSFNAMYLRNKQNGVIGMIVYKGRETKLKTDQTTGQTGNSLVKSMLMGYDQAAEATLTNVDAGTWQIDYAARLRGQDEDLRQLASQLYGHHTFIGDGFKVVQQDGGHQVTQGVAIVGGLRIEMKQPEVIHPGTKPIGVWVDVHRSGSLLSEHQNHFTIITSVADLTDHVDSNGYPHYVAKLGTVQADNTVIDGRGQGGIGGSGAIPDTFALWKRSMAEAGYDLIGQFGTKIRIQNVNQVLLSKNGTEVYAWLGALPKDVSADETLESSSGTVADTWEPITDKTFRCDLVNTDNGDALIGVIQPFTGATKRTQHDKNTDTIHIKDFGGLCNGVANDAAALLLALATEKKVSLPGCTLISLSTAQVPVFMNHINNVIPDSPITIHLPAGDISIPLQVEINSHSAINIDLVGPESAQVSCSGIFAVTGSAKNYTVTYTLTTAADVAVGNYLYVGYVVGTGDCRVAEGVWKVTAVSGNNVTVKHTLNATWPALTVTGARCIPIKTILRWPVTQRGIAIAGTTLRSMQNLILASRFDISSGVAADGYSDGLQIGASSDQLNTDSTESNNLQRGAVWCRNFGIVEWTNNGLQVAGGSFVLYQGAICSNGWRGFQAASCGSITSKYTASIGNGATGYESEASGDIVANGSIAAGNGQQGAFTIGGGFITFNSGQSICNKGSGMDARNISGIVADSAVVRLNGEYGLNSTNSNIVFGNGAVCESNTLTDTVCDEGGTIDGKGAATLGVIKANSSAGCTVVLPNGKVVAVDSIPITNAASSASIKMDVTSIGDMVLSFDSAGTGNYVAKTTTKLDGVTYPMADAAVDFGRSANRYKTGFFSNGTQTTSDATLKTPVRPFTTAEIAAASNLSRELGIWEWLDTRGDRLHCGLTVQKTMQIMKEQELDPFAYSFICYDEWIDEFDDKGALVTPAGSRYSFRDNELNRFIMRGLAARLDAIESK